VVGVDIRDLDKDNSSSINKDILKEEEDVQHTLSVSDDIK